MPKLTKRLVEQLRVSPSDYFVWESDTPGFGVRVYASGRKSYLIQYRDASARTRRLALGPHGVLTPEQARALAQTHLARVRAGGDPAQEKKAARVQPTVAAFATSFLDTQAHALRPQTVHNYQGLLTRHVLPALGYLTLAAVTRADVQALHSHLAHVPTQANRVLALCSTLFQVAEAWGLRPEGSNPARRIARFREVARERYLTPAELARLGAVLLRAVPEGLASVWTVALVRLLLLTGARWGEIRTLRWEWIDWQRGVARLPESKTGAKTLYLAPAALTVLAELGRSTQGLVLPGRKEKPRAHPLRQWRRLCAAAGITNLRPHDLRHTFASFGATLGLSLQVVGRLLGHADTQTTQRYAHLAPDPVSQAASLVGEAVERALVGEGHITFARQAHAE
jgi:integrase